VSLRARPVLKYPKNMQKPCFWEFLGSCDLPHEMFNNTMGHEGSLMIGSDWGGSGGEVGRNGRSLVTWKEHAFVGWTIGW